MGLPESVQPDGNVTFSYPTAYANSLRGQWGYVPMNTSDYAYGASFMFPSDCYGSQVQAGNCPFPTTMEGSNEVFAATAQLFGEAFTFAHQSLCFFCVVPHTLISC